MSSTIQLPEDQLIELLLQLRKTAPDQAKAILNSQPQITYALVALMVKMGVIDIPIFQQTLATFAPQQNGTQPPLIPAIPPHLQPQNSRNGAPQFAMPPPGTYATTVPHHGPAYPQYTAEGHPLPAGHYSVPAPPQTTGQNIPAALAAIPENQREVVLKLVNMSPEEIATLPPNERASVIQLRASLGIH
jgi:cleavage stimulation factor subunit 2